MFRAEFKERFRGRDRCYLHKWDTSVGNDFETIVVDRVGYEFSGIGENYQSHGGSPL